MAKCPKCSAELDELEEDFENMTEGQQADYDAGFERPHSCSKCGYFGLHDVTVYDYDDPEVDELVKITRINPSSFEDVIENALKNKCFIEATSLIHNVIEAYLKRKLEDFFHSNPERLNLLRKKINFRYLKDYNSFSYILGVIDKQLHDGIVSFNKERNKAIHDLLKKETTIEELRLIARRGREIQMKLNPLNHSDQHIRNIMDEFDRITD